jgi:hypothetical protein
MQVMKKRYLLIAALILTGIGLSMLASYRSQAVQAAQSIISKDAVGDDTTADIKALTDYVHGHTRASVSFTLDGSYNRAVAAAQQTAAGGSGNASAYSTATAACTQRDPVKTANCITAYIQTHTAPGAQPSAVAMPDKSKYTYNLNAPGWAPDAAGLSLLAAAILLVLTLYLGFMRLGRSAY